MVPDYIFSRAWMYDDFVIPIDRAERTALRLQLEAYSHYGIMFLPENSRIRKMLCERIELIENQDAPEVKGLDIPVPAVFFSKEWIEGNFVIPMNDSIRGEQLDRLKKVLYATEMLQLRRRNVRTVLKKKIAAIEAYNAAQA